MRDDKVIAVVIPAFDEVERVGRVVASIPSWVDHIVVVDDASTDGTAHAAEESARGRSAAILRHPSNRGVGAAIVTGYREALARGAHVIAVMAGDDQMDPRDLASVVDPVIRGAVDYVKGNRFAHAERRRMPIARRVAGRLLAALTRAATGFAIDDSQCGYTAIAANAAAALPLEELWPRYGYPNDLLALLASSYCAVGEVPVRPVYAGERSGVRPWHAVVVAALIVRRWAIERHRPRLTSLSARAPGR